MSDDEGLTVALGACGLLVCVVIGGIAFFEGVQVTDTLTLTGLPAAYFVAQVIGSAVGIFFGFVWLMIGFIMGMVTR